MSHPLAEGLQRVRCYPFGNHTFQGRNIKDNVFLLPVETTKHFSLPQDKDKLQFGKVQLLFSMLVPGNLGRFKEVHCAFIKYFDLFKPKGRCTQICDDCGAVHCHCTVCVHNVYCLYCVCAQCVILICLWFFPERGGDELQKEGHIRLYETTNSFEVLPVTHILGRLPILPDFGDPSIPHRMNGKAKAWFPLGTCDSSEGAQDGSKLFYVNHFAMTWARSKRSLFR
jgi:hypothetical protein